MDWNTMGELGLSVMIFAPGLVLLVVFAFVGLLMMLEKAGVFGSRAQKTIDTGVVAVAANPQPGQVTDGLKASNEAAAEVQERAVGDGQ